MRFKKGDKVEVLNKREDHAQSWWCAEIISCSGHKYYVRYDRDLPSAGSCVERVQRRAIRPCPPSATGRLDWECFFVRFLGSSTELIVNSCGIRLRQFWHDNKWVALQKESAKCSDRTNSFSKELFNSKVWTLVDDQFQDGKNIYFGNTSQTFAMGAKKRPRICSRTRQKCPGAFRMKRDVEKGRHQGANALKSTRWNKGQSWRPVKLASMGLR